MMKEYFWKKLPKQFIALAPMEDVTDRVFRDVIHHMGTSDIYFTEFVPVRGIINQERETRRRLQYKKQGDKPLIAQIWGNNPEDYKKAVPLLEELGFDGIDINMGCPQKKIVRRGECSALITQPNLAKELYFAAKESTHLPVSIKTRIGFTEINLQWIDFLLNFPDLPALTLHGRIAKPNKEQVSHSANKIWLPLEEHMPKALKDAPAFWQAISYAVEKRNQLKNETKILGNGGIFHPFQINQMFESCGVDGVMIARGIFDDPFLIRSWMFRHREGYKEFKDLPPLQKINWAEFHLRRYEETWNIIEKRRPLRSFNTMKKFFKIYIRDFHNSSFVCSELMKAENYTDAYEILKKTRRDYI